jgi:hypothetical protein
MQIYPPTHFIPRLILIGFCLLVLNQLNELLEIYDEQQSLDDILLHQKVSVNMHIPIVPLLLLSTSAIS